MSSENSILIYGGEETASAIAIKLFRSGLNPIIYVNDNEIFLRYNLCFGDAIYQNKKIIEEVTATTIPENLLNNNNNNSYLKKVDSAVKHIIKDLKIPVLHQISFGDAVEIAKSKIIINTLADPLPQVAMEKSQIVIGCYPHHTPGKECHYAIETRLSYQLGDIYSPETQNIPDNREKLHFFKNPFEICTSPIEGVWVAYKSIGEKIKFNESLGKMNEIDIKSPYDGQIWGILHSGKFYAEKTHVAKIYTAFPSENYRYFSFQENAVAGAALEVILRFINT